MSETISDAGTLSTVGLEKKSFKGGGVIHRNQWPIRKCHRGFSICGFSCCLPENIDTLYLKVVGFISLPKKSITKKIGFCNYNELDAEYQDMW